MRLTMSLGLCCLALVHGHAFAQAPRAVEEAGVVDFAVAPAFPIGTVISYAAVLDEKTAVSLDEAGWVPADGRTLPRAGKYSKLAAVLKDKYRRPGDDVVNSFRLPDLVGRAPIGASTVIPSSPTEGGSHPLGAHGGNERISLSASDLPHVHRVEGTTTGVREAYCCASNRTLPQTDGFNHDHSVSIQSQGVSGATSFSVDNRQPYLTLHFLVRYR